MLAARFSYARIPVRFLASLAGNMTAPLVQRKPRATSFAAKGASRRGAPREVPLVAYDSLRLGEIGLESTSRVRREYFTAHSAVLLCTFNYQDLVSDSCSAMRSALMIVMPN